MEKGWEVEVVVLQECDADCACWEDVEMLEVLEVLEDEDGGGGEDEDEDEGEIEGEVEDEGQVEGGGGDQAVNRHTEVDELMMASGREEQRVYVVRRTATTAHTPALARELSFYLPPQQQQVVTLPFRDTSMFPARTPPPPPTPASPPMSPCSSIQTQLPLAEAPPPSTNPSHPHSYPIFRRTRGSVAFPPHPRMSALLNIPPLSYPLTPSSLIWRWLHIAGNVPGAEAAGVKIVLEKMVDRARVQGEDGQVEGNEQLLKGLVKVMEETVAAGQLDEDWVRVCGLWPDL